jgi:hypothetical protein
MFTLKRRRIDYFLNQVLKHQRLVIVLENVFKFNINSKAANW